MPRLITLPRLIDCHVHFREPGLTHKATMASEAKAAVCGGVGTVCEMPNTVPPTVTIAALADKVRRAEALNQYSPSTLDVRFFFGVTEAEHIHILRELWTGASEEMRHLRSRCCGVKIFLDHSTGNQGIDWAIVEDVFRLSGELSIPLVAHCEDPEVNAKAAASIPQGGDMATRDASLHSLMRPPESEQRAIAHAIDLARTHRTPLHIAHLSTVQGLELVRRAKRERLGVTCEAAPHHLFLTVDDYPALGALGKVNPPLRSREHQEALWEGVRDGTVDCIATDHAPHTLQEKRCEDPFLAPSGVPEVETMLPLLLTVASGGWPHPGGEIRHSGFEVRDIVRLCFENPNRIFRLGKDPDAERMTIDLDAEWVIHASDLHSACGWTPYEGWRVRGRVDVMHDQGILSQAWQGSIAGDMYHQ